MTARTTTRRLSAIAGGAAALLLAASMAGATAPARASQNSPWICSRRRIASLPRRLIENLARVSARPLRLTVRDCSNTCPLTSPHAYGRAAEIRVTIAKMTKLTHTLTHDEPLVEAFEEMGTRAEEMIRVAMDSFARRHLEGAESLVDLDELIDRANRRVVS